MYLIPNLTLILMQLFPFLITLVGMYFIIFKPMLQYLDDREEQIGGSQQHALQLAEEAKQNFEASQKELKAAQKRATLIRQEATAQAMLAYTEQVSKARRESYEEIQKAENELAKETKEARQSLQSMANDIAADISGRILGRSLT